MQPGELSAAHAVNAGHANVVFWTKRNRFCVAAAAPAVIDPNVMHDRWRIVDAVAVAAYNATQCGDRCHVAALGCCAGALHCAAFHSMNGSRIWV